MRAKVLDFGLAKPMARDAAAVPPKETFSSFDGTADGRVLGTPAYMSPEQARGQTVDTRTDVWAFGCVLYEMLTGRPSFEGDTMSDTFVSILEREPDWVALPAATPASVRRLLERCLRKDPRKRLHDIADAILDIDDATTMPPATTGADATAASGRIRASLSTLHWLATIVLAAALAWVGWLYYRAAGALPTEPAQLTIHPPGGVGVSHLCAVAGRPLSGVCAAIDQQAHGVGALARHRRNQGASVDGRRPRAVLEARQPGNRLLRR